ncbi:hypothetical protein E4U27_000800 [Claviceps purpurea]|nr:hypothetical protein E4U51_001417 [Claviceps purpurea]KAG6184882.1 hypothetical protein E4U27_000800 [Claviceps purpurea]
MKFLSLIYIFGAIVSPVIAHTDPNVKEAVDAVNQDMSGAPTERLARRPPASGAPQILREEEAHFGVTGFGTERKCNWFFRR